LDLQKQESHILSYIGFPISEQSWDLDSISELKGKEFWFHDAQRTLYEKLSQPPNQYQAKNVIFFLGDGMSVPTVTAGRIFDGQLRGVVGERNRLEFEKFNYVGLSKVGVSILKFIVSYLQ